MCASIIALSLLPYFIVPGYIPRMYKIRIKRNAFYMLMSFYHCDIHNFTEPLRNWAIFVLRKTFMSKAMTGNPSVVLQGLFYLHKSVKVMNSLQNELNSYLWHSILYPCHKERNLPQFPSPPQPSSPKSQLFIITVST